jgi:hypothetical protein
MDKTDLAIIILIIAMAMSFVASIFSIYLLLTTTQNEEEHICIEHLCPGNPYSEMNKHCVPVSCTILEDAVIDDTVYPLEGCYQNETGQDPDDLVMHLTCLDAVVSKQAGEQL